MAKLNKIVFRKAPKPLSHASPYSIPVYRKLGFIETDNMLEENGIRYLPMEMLD